MKISIIIPAYNEEKTIAFCLKEVEDFCKKRFQIYEIIVVDDGSKDKTCQLVSQNKSKHIKLIKNKKNKGKGYSVKKGLLNAKNPLILFSDADLATPLEELDKMSIWIEKGFDVVIASRNMRDSNIVVKQPWYRQLVGKVFASLVNFITIRGFKDTQCGFKLFRKEAAQKIAKLQTLERWSFDVEMLVIAKNLNYKIKEVPVKWINDRESKVNPMKDSARMLKDLLKIKTNDMKGKYKAKNNKT